MRSPKGYQVLPFHDIHSSEIHIKMLIWIWFSQWEGTDRVKRILAGIVAALFLAFGSSGAKNCSSRFFAAARVRAKPGIPAGGR